MPGPGPLLAAAALLLGGLRDPRLFAAGGAAAWLLVARGKTPLGPARAWLPWLGWAALSAVLSEQPLAALPALARWSAALAFASLAAAWSAEERRGWLKALGLSAVPLFAAALWTGRHEGFAYGPTMTGLIPPYYNYTAFALAVIGAGGGALALDLRADQRERIAGGAVAVLGLGFALIAHSRGALLGLAAASVVWSARRFGARGILRILMAVAAVVFFFFMFVDLVKPNRRFAEARPKIWAAAAAAASEKPWLGEGPGSFAVGFRRHPVEAENNAARWGLYTEYAHSEPMQAAGETGWAGLGLWLLGFLACFAPLLRRSDEEPAREAAAAGLAAASVQLAADNMLQIPGLAFLFLGASAVAGGGKPDGPRWPRWAPLAGCVLALTAWMPRALADKSAAAGVAVYPAEAERWETLAWELTPSDAAKADAAWSRAEALAPFNGLYPHQRARLAAARGDWVSAEALARKAVLDEPGYSDARVLRAEALLRLKRPVEALSELAATRRALATRGDKPRTAHYDEAVWAVDEKELARVERLAGTRR